MDRHSSYFAYPFEFQQLFRVETPYVRVSPLVTKRKAEQQLKAHASRYESVWTRSTVVVLVAMRADSFAACVSVMTHEQHQGPSS